MIVNQVSQLQTVISTLASNKSPIAIDTETNITDKYHERYCMGISIAQGDDYYYIPVGHKNPFVPQANIEYLPEKLFEELKHHKVIFHNAKFDLHVLKRAGVFWKFENVWDTMMMSHYIDENRLQGHDLDSLSKDYCSVKKNVELAKALKIDWNNAFIEGMHQYAQEDAIATLQLYEALDHLMEPDYRQAWEEYDRDFMFLLMAQEEKGILLNVDECNAMNQQCLDRMAQIKEELGFDPKKKEAHDRIFGEPPTGYGLKPLSFTAKGKPQLNTKFLERTNHPVCGLMLEYSKLQKLSSSYYGSYPNLVDPSGYLHPNFKQHGTKTGRTSCEVPNLQQIPRDSEVKYKLFNADPDRELWEIDFSALEPRLTAVYSQDPNLLDVFINHKDFHQMTADLINRDRHIGKISNLTLFYGGANSLSDTLNISYAEAQKIQQQFNKAYAKANKFKWDLQNLAQRQGYVRLFSGRRRHFDKFNNPKDAFNSVIQGGGFEILKRAALKLHAAGVDVRNNVHDSNWIMVDSQSDIPEAERIMTEWTKEAFGLDFVAESKRLK